MKKIFLLVLSMIIIGTGSFAQDKKKGGDAKKTETAAPAEGQKLKKDGTPDKRYKENKEKKEEAAPAGPLKKDGTPDKRYKANKEASKETTKK
jgi:hypothetical protein